MIDFGYGVNLDAPGWNDIHRMRAWRNDPQIRKWCRQTGLISDISQSKWLEAQDADPTIKMYLVRTKKDVDIGVCGLTSIDPVCRRAEFSLYISPEHQKNGLGGAALKTLLSHGFRDLNMNCIWGESFQGNPAMYLFKSLGFQDEGTRRQFYFKNGTFIDCHLFSMLLSEFKEREGQWLTGK